jgi:putative nucleotidyltransferase with HDIG domain
VAAILRDQEAYLVGGAVRDLLLGQGRARHDLDLALPHDALSHARHLADRLGGHLVILKEERGTARVLAEAAGERYQLDLAEFRGEGLETDLRGRDFTLNALAVRLSELVLGGEAPIIDPLGGLADLEGRRLRLCSETALRDDPVRALRGVRLALALDIEISPDLAEALSRSGPRLSDVAAERLRDELLRLLELPRGGRGLRELDRLGLLETLLPEVGPMRRCLQGPPHRFDVLEHSLRAVEALEGALDGLGGLFAEPEALRVALAASPEAGVSRAALLKLATFLHDVAKPATRTEEQERIRFIGHDRLGAEMTRAIGQRLRLAGAAVQLLERLVRHHLRPMHLSQVAEITPRARYRFYRDLGDATSDLILLVVADAAATVGADPGAVMSGATGRLLRDLLDGWRPAREEARVPPLINGHDIMAAFGLSPGPLIGRLLAQAREAQALGLVKTKAEALAALRGALGNTGGV